MTQEREHCRDAVLLAAGRGTRLGRLTEHCPKPMLDVAGRPIIGHILGGLAEAGVRRVVIVTGYLAEVVEQGLGDGSRFGLRLTYRRQQTTDGTARALALARAELAGRRFFFGWGDILVLPDNYGRVIAMAEHGGEVLAVNEVDDPWAGAAVYVDGQARVQRIVEKPLHGSSTTRWNNAGFGVLGPSIWPYVDALQPSARGEYELPQAVAALVEAGTETVLAVPVQGPWFDIGTPENLAEARAVFADRG
ncbi:MAG: nucleotidyltransferase family protein [Deltaproteobacteria bacterium]|nr:nucleotidyltransferase family protein [Deltaproteobacteria bacterium]